MCDVVLHICVVIVPSLLSSDISKVTMALARMIFVFGSHFSELWCRGSPSLLCSDSLTKTSALAGPVFNSVCSKLRRMGLPNLLYSDSSAEVPTLAKSKSVIVYFIPLQKPNV